ncbi:MAG: glycosyltransferase family 4 protein [Candidatus Acidiferrales bacterium]
MKRSLKFCHLTTFYPPYSFGGDAMYLYRLVNALARRGHEVDVVHCADSYHVLHPTLPLKEFPNHPSVTVHTLKSRWGVLSPLVSQQTGSTWPNTNRIRQVLLSKKFDVIHYHNISLLGPAVLRLDPDYRDFLKIYTMHEHWLVCPMHVLWKNNERVCDRPQCFRCALKSSRPPQWWRYTDLLENCTRSVDAFFSPSRFTRDMHHQRGFARPIKHLPYFAPTNENEASPLELPSTRRPYFLFVGRLEKIKGLQDLIPTFRGYPHADLLVAGTGEFETELRRKAAAAENIVFLGPLQQSELRRLYRHAIAVLVPSICYEVFGIIILEAHRERTPVIVRRLGGLQEVVEESQGGFTFDSQVELLSAMERLRTNEALRREMGERGYRKYLELWTEEAHLETYMKLLESAAFRKFDRVPWHPLDQ